VYDNSSFVIVDGIKRRNRKKAIPQTLAWAEAYGFVGGADE
jgi:hypothetical protein